MRSGFDRPMRIWFWLGFAAAVAAFAFVLVYGVDVPFWDEWDFVPFLQAAERGELSLDALVSLHNEHRIAVPRVFALLVAWMTSYDTVAQCLFTVSHLTVLLAYVYAAIRRAGERAGTPVPLGRAPFWFVPVAWLLMSWRQVENLLWGFQIGLTLPLTFSFVALFHLQTALAGARSRWLHLTIAAIAAFLGSFSSAMGLLVWPAGAVVLALHWLQGDLRWRTAATWLAVAALTWGLYFVGFHAPPAHEKLGGGFDVGRMASFFATLCGAWATAKAWGAVVGVLVLAAFALAFVTLWRRKLLAENGVWIGMAAFCFATLAMITFGRSGAAPLAYRSGYTTYSMPIVACLVVVLVAAARGTGSRAARLGVAFLLFAVVVGTAAGYKCGQRTAWRERDSRTALAATLVDYRNRADTELELLHPKAYRVRTLADFLAEQRLSVFADEPASPRRIGRQVYHWGDELHLGTGGNARPYLGAGWSIDEVGFVWSGARSAFLELQVDAHTGPLRLDLTYAMTLLAPGQVESQRVQACIAGEVVGEFVATTNGHVSIELSAPPIAAGPFEFELRFPDAFVPAELGVSGERRTLAVAVAALRLAAL